MPQLVKGKAVRCTLVKHKADGKAAKGAAVKAKGKTPQLAKAANNGGGAVANAAKNGGGSNVKLTMYVCM